MSCRWALPGAQHVAAASAAHAGRLPSPASIPGSNGLLVRSITAALCPTDIGQRGDGCGWRSDTKRAARQ